MLICNVLIIKTKEEVMNLKYFTLLTATVSAFFVSSAIAAETINESEAVKVQKPSELRLNVRRIGLELSSTEVSNSEEYENSPVSQLNTDSQSVIKGLLDIVLEYDHEKMRWDNSIFLNYGKTKIKPRNEFAETTENEDKILLTSEFISFFSTTHPQVSSITSGLPPVLNVTIGVPQDKASALTNPKTSSLVGFTNRSAAV